MIADALSKKSIELRKDRTAEERKIDGMGMISLIEEYAARKRARGKSFMGKLQS